MKKRTLAIVPIVMGLGALTISATPAAAEPGDALGSITISTTVDGGESSEGFSYALTSQNCGVAPATAVTDASGTAVFADLPIGQADGSPCLYDVVATERAGYLLNTENTVLTGLTAGTVSEAPSTLELTESSGVLRAPTRNPEPGGNVLKIACLGGGNTSEMRAGRNPVGGDCTLDWERQSGLGYASPAALATAIETGGTTIGTLTHFNQTIQRGFHNALLDVQLTFRDTATGESVQFTPSYTLAIDETTDTVLSPASCKYPEAGELNRIFACADRVTLAGGDDQTFTLGGVDVNLQAQFGVLDADGVCSEPTSSVFTAERTDTTFCLLASVSPTFTVQPTSITVVNESILPVSPATPALRPATTCTPETAGQPLWESAVAPADTDAITYGQVSVDENHVATLTATTTGPNRVFADLAEGWVLNGDQSATWTHQLSATQCPAVPTTTPTPTQTDQPTPTTPSTDAPRLSDTGAASPTGALAVATLLVMLGGAGAAYARLRTRS